MDWEATKTAKESEKFPSREYQKPDGVVSFDRESSLALSSVAYPEEMSHIRVKKGMEKVPVEFSLKEYDAPEQRFCPANVYEYVKNDEGKVSLKIHNENCIHCKTSKRRSSLWSGRYLVLEAPTTPGCSKLDV